MNKFDENEFKKMYYSIGEVAQFFDVNTSLIRFWEKEFDFKASKKNAKGNRLFTVKDIKHFNTIYDLVKNQGFTLEGAKKSLHDKPKGDKTSTHNSEKTSLDTASIVQNLERIKSKLLELKRTI